MSEDEETTVPTMRTSPVGDPVVRGDPSIAGEVRSEAVELDPSDPASLEEAVEILRRFAATDADQRAPLGMLRGATACAVLVRGEGSYRAAADRAGEGVSVSFIRTWARVHDLPLSVRKKVATGAIAPSTAKHIARLTGADRLYLAWATIDHELTVREVRAIVGDVHDGDSVQSALETQGYSLGEVTVELPLEEYCLLRQEASLADESPGETIAALFRES